MSEATTVRLAGEGEINWINARYDEVDFIHSDFANEKIVIAEVSGERAGLGRLCKVTNEDAELGGMYVFEEFRGHGVADKIVRLLLEQSTSYKRIFCIPFSHLEGFYKRHGFRDIEFNTIEVPTKVTEKHNWCNQHYEGENLLLVLTNSCE